VEVVLADAELDGDLPGDAAQVAAGRGGLLFASASASARPGVCSRPVPRRRGGWNQGRSAPRFSPATCRP